MRPRARSQCTTVHDRGTRTIRVLCWLVALSLGALQAWALRFPIGEDGVSYLDIADAYLRGDWHNAFSAYWSPPIRGYSLPDLH